MSLWSRILDTLARLAPGARLSSLFESTPPERTIAFTIATIALGAKIAKADGRVTRDEVAAFREVFHIPPDEEANAARVFDLARTDVAGFEDYARRIARMFGDGSPTLCDLMEGLFHIAVADGEYHPHEDDFLHRVATIFNLPDRQFRALRARFAPGRADPWTILGVEPGASLDEARRAWRRQVRDTHPDRLAARGLPEEAVKLAERRLVDLNAAWERVQAEAA